MPKISLIFGTRPEAIKLSPLILMLKELTKYEIEVCVTGQHNEMLYQVLDIFGIKPDYDLKLMRPGQSLAALTSLAVEAVDTYIKQAKPDLAIVQGDTTTVFASALAAFYNRVKVAHVEAGLRTWNKYSPFPEELNRVITTSIADVHFAPTEISKSNLLNENVSESSIYVTGNTVIDALNIAVNNVRKSPVLIPGLENSIIEKYKMIVLITGHRRENFGQGFLNICNSIKILSQRFCNTLFVYPVHLNPNVQGPVYEILSGIDNVKLIEPLSYLPFVQLMDKSTLVLTDSGGVQEEAPSLGKPVLVMRDTTERPEAVDAGTVKLVSTDSNVIVDQTSLLLSDKAEYERMAKSINPYGDGNACRRIIDIIKKQLG